MTQASVGFHCPECLKRQGQRVVNARDLGQQSRPPLTSLLIGISVVLFVLQMATGGGRSINSELTANFLLFGPFVQLGEFWLILTSGFLHNDPIHLGFNMFLLWMIGKGVEQQLGRIQFALLYFSSLFAASAFVLAFNFEAPTLGASGAVLGMFGGVAGLMLMRGRSLKEVPGYQLILLNLFLPLVIPGISFWGHLGGVVGGFITGALLALLSDKARMSPPTTYAVAALVMIGWFGVAAVIGLSGGLV